MYKFGPKEVVPLVTTVPDAAPSIIIPSDVPIYSTAGLYSNADHLLHTRSLPSIIGPTHVPEHQGYGDASGSWGGGTIKSIRQASGACIEVDDAKVDRDECLITVIAAEV
ncbi:KH domain-containing protein At4g18375 [Linum perenne]